MDMCERCGKRPYTVGVAPKFGTAINNTRLYCAKCAAKCNPDQTVRFNIGLLRGENRRLAEAKSPHGAERSEHAD